MSQNHKAFKDAFALFDKRGKGRVTADLLADLLRACGQNPTLAEVKELQSNIEDDFDFETFLGILNRPGGFRQPGEPGEYTKGFEVFDKSGTGMIGVGELRYVLTSLGEQLTNDEVDELLKGVTVSKDGNVNYSEFVKMVLAN
ncbi:hypothetical protein CANCADRAFT_31837 [Tortispora caseinolytica NRRL Y-17796]|uniref:EF-hand domain-containing protein n=1 Tax=Tortispora caseinolytica NRRL Y-17796 TaxID=767744 RepID=A0A1E4THA1_9ASCO|nr:hypothetical protein CANCADRAFT_31837 [Tortispora caseinolytica NRRL Y-17796]